eukprot:jgi/Botrbrau1/4038/Bobra.0016s0041.2
MLDKFTMEDDPYLWCALHGATHCALMLREGGLKPGPPLPVACFQAGGISGQIQWRKHIAVSLREAAMLAGFPTTAKVLRKIESGVPLHWEPSNHKAWPSLFKEKVRKIVEACAATPWFARLPGPVRVQVIRMLVKEIARKVIWREVHPAVWDGSWEEVVERQLIEAVNDICQQNRTQLPAPERAIEYRFRMNPAGRRPRLWGVLRGVAFFGGALLHPLIALGVGALAGTIAPADMALVTAGYALGWMRAHRSLRDV